MGAASALRRTDTQLDTRVGAIRPPFQVHTMVMAVADDLIAKSQQIRIESKRIRLNSIRVRVDAVRALSTTAEAEPRWESPEIAEKSIQKVKLAIERLRHDVDESPLVPAEMRDELRGQVEEIEARVQRVRESLKSHETDLSLD